LLEVEEALELLDQAGARVDGEVHGRGHAPPLGRLVGLEVDLAPELVPAAGPAPGEERGGVRGALEVPGGHAVGVRVVVDVLVVLVRADDVAYVEAAIVLEPAAARPEAGGLEEDLGARVEDERVVARGAPVAPDPEGDVGADVRLEVAGADGDEHQRRRRLRGLALLDRKSTRLNSSHV